MKNLHTIALFLTLTSCISQSADDNGWITATGSRREDNRRQRRVQQSAQQKQEVRKKPRSAWRNRAAVVATVVSGRGSTRSTIVTPQATQRVNAAEVSSGNTTHKPKRPCKPRAPMKPREPGYFASHKEKRRYQLKYAKYEQALTKYQENMTTFETELAAFEEEETAYHQVYPTLAAATNTHTS